MVLNSSSTKVLKQQNTKTELRQQNSDKRKQSSNTKEFKLHEYVIWTKIIQKQKLLCLDRIKPGILPVTSRQWKLDQVLKNLEQLYISEIDFLHIS